MVTVVAATGVAATFVLFFDCFLADVVGFPKAEMHEPTVTAEAEAVTV
jgi:hypothetical protein